MELDAEELEATKRLYGCYSQNETTKYFEENMNHIPRLD